jgi:hypothetical protein
MMFLDMQNEATYSLPSSTRKSPIRAILLILSGKSRQVDAQHYIGSVNQKALSRLRMRAFLLAPENTPPAADIDKTLKVPLDCR